MILGLDISTSCIGCCVYSGKEIIHIQYIEPIGDDIYEKIDFSYKILKDLINKNNITKVYVEEPLVVIPKQSSAETIKVLIRFNFALLSNIYKDFAIKPYYVPNSSAKRILLIKKIVLKDPELIKLDKVKLDKRLCFQYCLNNFKNFSNFFSSKEKYSRGAYKNLWKDCAFDCSDAVIIAVSGGALERENSNS